MSFPLSAVNQITEMDLKILLSLYIISDEQKIISFNEIISNLGLTNKEFFEILKDLFELDLINFSIREVDHSLCFRISREKELMVNLRELSKTSFKLMNEIIFMQYEETFTDLVNDVYIFHDMYDKEYMAKYIKEKRISKSDLKSKELTETQKIQQLERARIRRKANLTIDYLYSELKKRFGITLTPSQREYEYIQAKIFVKSKDQYDIDEIRRAIDWFLEHPFWRKVVTNIKSLNTHFIKYVAETKDNQNQFNYL